MFAWSGAKDELGEIEEIPRDQSEKRRNLYDQALRCIDREENLIHYRMSWGLQWNGGAFAALFAVAGLPMAETTKAVVDLGVAAFGIGVCWIAYVAVRAAHKQSHFVIMTLCKGLGVDMFNWKCEFIRPFGNARNVHPQARRISKFLFVGLGLLWLVVIISILHQDLNMSVHVSLVPPANPASARPN